MAKKKQSALSKRLVKIIEKYEGEPVKFSHSVSYHTFFQGWSERKRVNANGRGYRIERTYTADYLAFTNDRNRWIRRKVWYTLLYLAAFVLTVLALSRPSPCNSTIWVVIPSFLEVVFLLLLLPAVINYGSSPLLMTIGVHEVGALRLKRNSLYAGTFSGLGILTMLGYFLFVPHTFDGQGALALALQALATGVLLLLHFTERRTAYTRIKSGKETPYDGNEIW